MVTNHRPHFSKIASHCGLLTGSNDQRMRTGFRIRNTVLHIERIVKIEPFGKLFFPKYQNLRQRCPRFGRTGAYGISGFTGSSTEKTSDHFGGLPGAEGIASRYTRYRDSERSW